MEIKGLYSRYNIQEKVLYLTLEVGVFELPTTLDEAIFIICGLQRESMHRKRTAFQAERPQFELDETKMKPTETWVEIEIEEIEDGKEI
jgi:transcriptional/translational regulatory protein YebC/TACO1